MAHSQFAERCIYIENPRIGAHVIPQITVTDGASTDGIILRTCHKPVNQNWLTMTAGETFADADEQFLAYMDETDGRLYKCRTHYHTHEDIGTFDNTKDRRLFIVDQYLQAGAITAGNSLSYCLPYKPVLVDEVELNQVTAIGDIYLRHFKQNRYFNEAVVGAAKNNAATIFVPTTLFQASDASGNATEVSGFTGTALSADITLDDGATDYSVYAGSTTASYVIVAYYNTGPVGVMGYLGEVSAAGTAYTFKVYTTAAMATQTWAFGNATDIANDFTSNCTYWGIFPVENGYVGETTYAADDDDGAGIAITLSSEQTGIIGLASTISTRTSLWYSKEDALKVPTTVTGETWTAGTVYKNGEQPCGFAHTVVLLAESGVTPVISGKLIIKEFK